MIFYLVKQVSGDCERAVRLYLMAFKMRRALAPQLRSVNPPTSTRHLKPETPKPEARNSRPHLPIFPIPYTNERAVRLYLMAFKMRRSLAPQLRSVNPVQRSMRLQYEPALEQPPDTTSATASRVRAVSLG